MVVILFTDEQQVFLIITVLCRVNTTDYFATTVMTLTNQDHRIKNERIEIITRIFAECCRYPNVYIEPIQHDFGVAFQIQYLGKQIVYALTNADLYIGKKTCKYSDYYVIGNSIRDKLDIPEDTRLGTL